MKNSYYVTDNYIFFYGSFFSQWYSCDIVIDNVEYCTCEQYMMAEKARLFNDEESLEKIMKAKYPSVQKALGRKVKNFDKDKWEEKAIEIVYQGNFAKFSQHNDIGSILLKSGNKIIVEASLTDCIWGVGLKANDPKILDPKNWRGTNWLGKIIMLVREDLRNGRKKNKRRYNISDMN